MEVKIEMTYKRDAPDLTWMFKQMVKQLNVSRVIEEPGIYTNNELSTISGRYELKEEVGGVIGGDAT